MGVDGARCVSNEGGTGRADHRLGRVCFVSRPLVNTLVVLIHICRIINVIDIYHLTFSVGDECEESSPEDGATGCILS